MPYVGKCAITYSARPRLTAKRVERVVSISWASCCSQRTSAFSALDVSRRCALQIYILLTFTNFLERSQHVLNIWHLQTSTAYIRHVRSCSHMHTKELLHIIRLRTFMLTHLQLIRKHSNKFPITLTADRTWPADPHEKHVLTTIQCIARHFCDSSSLPVTTPDVSISAWRTRV